MVNRHQSPCEVTIFSTAINLGCFEHSYQNTLETRYNTLQYNANWVIMRLQCSFRFCWEPHPATESTAGRDV